MTDPEPADQEPIPICHACGMGYSCPEHDPRPDPDLPKVQTGSDAVS